AVVVEGQDVVLGVVGGLGAGERGGRLADHRAQPRDVALQGAAHGGEGPDVGAQGLVVGCQQLPALHGGVVQVEDEAVQGLVVVGQHPGDRVVAAHQLLDGLGAAPEGLGQLGQRVDDGADLVALVGEDAEGVGGAGDEVVDLLALPVDDGGQVLDQV